MRFGIWGLLALVLIVPQVGCNRIKKAREEAQKAEALEEAREDDRNYERILKGKDEDGARAMEARQYLAPNQPKNGLGTVAREPLTKWVDEFYQAGAVKVHVVYTPAEGPRINTCTALLVEMPRQPEPRAKLIATYNRIDRELSKESAEVATDLGQKFLYLETGG